jgi:hypothetical protein
MPLRELGIDTLRRTSASEHHEIFRGARG